MEERRKLIRDLEDKRKMDLAAAGDAFGALGKSLLEELKKTGYTPAAEKDAPAEKAFEEYLIRLAEIAENEERIRATEADIARYQEITEEISQKEKDKAKNSKALLSLYAQIGRQVLPDPAFANFSAGYQHDADELTAGIDAREARLDELEQKNGGIFAWVGKNAESLVVKTMLLKNQAELHKLYRAAGEKFISSGEDYADGQDELKDAAGEAGNLKREADDLVSEIASLKEEKKNTSSRFKGEGNPVRLIQDFEKKAAAAREELSKLYREFGRFAAENKRQNFFKPLFDYEDKANAEKAASFTESAFESEKEIKKLKAAIEIDNEKTKIEKLRRSIEDEGKKIEAARGTISEMEDDIQAAELRIGELTKLL